MKKILIIFILLQTILSAQTPDLQQIKLQLQWKYQFQFAGFIMAKEKGFYKDVGLDVELIEYQNGIDVIKELNDGKVDYSLSNSIISYRDTKLYDVTLIASYFQRSPLVIIAHKEIESVLDLKNKKIMISKNEHFNSALTTLLKYFNINTTTATFIERTYNINDFIDKKIDASTAFRSNELFLLDKKNIPYNIIDPAEYGFPTNANNIFTTHTKILHNPEQIENFLSASKKGWEYALYNIEETAKIIHTNYNTTKAIKHLIYEGKVTKELMLLDSYEIGEINKEFVLRAYKKLIHNNIIDSSQLPNKLMLNKKDIDKWIKQKYVEETKYTIATIVLIFLLLIIGIILIWSLKMKKEIKKRIIAEENLKYLAQHDVLTNLPNRILFMDRLNQSIKNATRFNEKIAVIFIDLDHFKDINDTLGHSVGDILLTTVANRLKNSIRKSDTIARFGGDEFAIILDRFSDTKFLGSAIETISNSLKTPIDIENKKLYVTLSLGISIYPDDDYEAELLLKNADAAMYKAKHNGRDNYQFYTADMTSKALERMKLASQLRESIVQNQIEVYYQLQLDSSNDEIIGMEALVRWNHPQKGIILPFEFITLAHEIGFIVELDEWVMKESIQQFKKWFDNGLNPGKLSLNLSALRLERDGFVESIEDMIRSEGIKPQCFAFEVTETKIMKNPKKSIQRLDALNDLGVKIYIDDFGTGYSSLSYLKQLPISKLKIDRSFIRDIPKDLDDIEITKTIIAMARSLNLGVIAEGVETQEQKEFLQENGCNEIQGYLFHKPSSAKEIEKILQMKEEN